MASTSSPEELKQVIVIRSDLGMGKGKIAAQASHASIDAFLDARRQNEKEAQKWKKEGMPKSVLKVESEKELVRIFQAAKDASLPCSLIHDAGKTQIAAGSKTCVGIGPARSGEIDKLTGELSLL
ncbi:aminoacyl-tRNA hydrolase [Candidatus Micrarchaeota archaeon CG10_big_fil_rev_8_21_14_0_10_45_29]|nr:MAG: aminoacyl-tRNA hydrolase [Candidatus Micrarchaeota archaeon CG10_big_fil_rev_8_21_14_0_10_45_29]